MLKPTIALLAVALSGNASAAGWRSLRVDASSEAAFEQSLADFKDKLSPARRYTFGESLKDIWLRGSQVAIASDRAGLSPLCAAARSATSSTASSRRLS